MCYKHSILIARIRKRVKTKFGTIGSKKRALDILFLGIIFLARSRKHLFQQLVQLFLSNSLSIVGQNNDFLVLDIPKKKNSKNVDNAIHIEKAKKKVFPKGKI